jgi:formamidopyrimidine-DNA glycosylase
MEKQKQKTIITITEQIKKGFENGLNNHQIKEELQNKGIDRSMKNTTTQHNYSTSNKKNKKKKQQQSNKDNFSLNNYSYDNSGFMDYIQCSSCNQVIIGVVNVKNNNYYCEECIKDNQKINAFIDDGY